MVPNTSINLAWVPALVAQKSDSGPPFLYGWVPIWAVGNASCFTIANMPGASFGRVVDDGTDTDSFLQGVSITGQEFNIGDPVLVRPGPGAGWTLYEMWPAGTGSSPSPPPPPPGPSDFGDGWGWIAGLSSTVCLLANISNGTGDGGRDFLPGAGNDIATQVITLVYHGDSNSWRAGKNFVFNGSFNDGNAILDFAVVNGNPALTAIGNDSNYSFSYNGAVAHTYDGELPNSSTPEAILFSGNGLLFGGADPWTDPAGGPPSGDVWPGPTFDTFDVVISPVFCSPSCCFGAFPDPMYVTINDSSGSLNGNYTGTVSLTQYANVTITYVLASGNTTITPGLLNEAKWGFYTVSDVGNVAISASCYNGSSPNVFTVSGSKGQYDSATNTIYLFAVGNETVAPRGLFIGQWYDHGYSFDQYFLCTPFSVTPIADSGLIVRYYNTSFSDDHAPPLDEAEISINVTG